MELICYKKCTTCRSIEKLLKDKNIEYKYINIDSETPSKEEIKEIHEKSKLDIKKLFNSRGVSYRELGLKDKIDQMTLEEKYQLLSTDGMLIKRPILIDGDQVYIGADVKKSLE